MMLYNPEVYTDSEKPRTGNQFKFCSKYMCQGRQY